MNESDSDGRMFLSKILVSMTINRHNHRMQTNTQNREEESQDVNSHLTPRRQLNYSNQPSIPKPVDCNTRKDTNSCTTQQGPSTRSPETMTAAKKKQLFINNRTIALERTAAKAEAFIFTSQIFAARFCCCQNTKCILLMWRLFNLSNVA